MVGMRTVTTVVVSGLTAFVVASAVGAGAVQLVDGEQSPAPGPSVSVSTVSVAPAPSIEAVEPEPTPTPMSAGGQEPAPAAPEQAVEEPAPAPEEPVADPEPAPEPKTAKPGGTVRNLQDGTTDEIQDAPPPPGQGQVQTLG